eukprot:GEMP01060087.1.p1 GENE.GEMP01060087.1~~GEMP01060087.1.p1  ORF type:complete len:247 (+),score=29.21 GEMP01060087.1:227-967(+)
MLFIFTLFICAYAFLGGVYILQRPKATVVEVLRHVIVVASAIVYADVVAVLCENTLPHPIPALLFGFVLFFFITAVSMLAVFQRFSVFISFVCAISMLLWAPIGLGFGKTPDDEFRKVLIVFVASLVAYYAFVYFSGSNLEWMAGFCAGYLLGGSVIVIVRVLTYKDAVDDFRPSFVMLPKTPQDAHISYQYHIAAIACGLVTWVWFWYCYRKRTRFQNDEPDPEDPLLPPRSRKGAHDKRPQKAG